MITPEILKARSKDEFISNITMVEEKAGEYCYWLELFFASSIIELSVFNKLHKEAEESTTIFTASGKTSQST